MIPSFKDKFLVKTKESFIIMKNIAEMSRSQAEKFVADCRDPQGFLDAMDQAKNLHIKKYAFHKGFARYWGAAFFAKDPFVRLLFGLQKTSEPEVVTVQEAFTSSLVEAVTEPMAEMEASIPTADKILEIVSEEPETIESSDDIGPTSMRHLQQLAEKYGETYQDVLGIYRSRGENLTKTRASLASRKGARTAKAKAGVKAGANRGESEAAPASESHP